jgi:hypothetical protein
MDVIFTISQTLVRIASALEEANRWRRYSFTPSGVSYTVEARTCNTCGTRFQADKGTWVRFSGAGCASCCPKESPTKHNPEAEHV